MPIQQHFLFESTKTRRWRYPAVAQRWLERAKLPVLDLRCQLAWKHRNSRLGLWEKLRLRPTANSMFGSAGCWGADFGSPVTRSRLTDCQQSARRLSLALMGTATGSAHRWERRSPASP